MKIESNSTEEKIVKATFEIIQTEGSKKATTKRIAAAAGVNEVTIFRKFRNKNNLISVAKDYHLDLFLAKLEDIFDYTEEDTIEEYLRRTYDDVVAIPETELAIIKIALEEISNIPDKQELLARITSTIFDKLKGFYELQLEKGEIKDIDTTVLAALSYSVTMQSFILWKIYRNIRPEDPERDKHFASEYLKILYYGIKPE